MLRAEAGVRGPDAEWWGVVLGVEVQKRWGVAAGVLSGAEKLKGCFLSLCASSAAHS